MPNTDAHKKTVVFAPLNWGLGHASRIIPLINKYKTDNWKIILASDGNALKFLQKEFPKDTIIDIDSKELKYSKQAFLLAHLWHILPSFLKNIKSDRKFVKKLIDSEKIDLIISDNRYGFRHSNIKSIVISHQLQLAFPPIFKWTKSIVQTQLNKWINEFHECWIVDNEQHSLAGLLSSTSALKIPYQFLGLQSRLDTESQVIEIDFLVVLSGIEPQRTILEDLLFSIFKDSKHKVTFIGGQFYKQKKQDNIQYIPYANTKELNLLINKSRVIIARSGFSTIMDLLKLNKKAILIPTPGQPEQEYLARFHSENPIFTIAKNNYESLNEIINNCC